VSRWVTRGVGVVLGIALIANGSGTRALGIFVLIASVVAAIAFEMARRGGSPRPREFANTYSADADEVFAALCSVIDQLGYRITSCDARQREIEFNTGMSWKTFAGQDFSGSVDAHLQGRSEVRLVGVISQRGLGSIQSVTWGETQKLGNRVLDQLAERINPSR
jgi:hypothetical protein